VITGSAQGGADHHPRRKVPPLTQQPEHAAETQAADEVTAAAQRRGAALVARDEAALRQLMHPGLQWTSFRGEVIGYEAYIAGNTRGDLRWRSQRLSDAHVVVAGDTAVLTAAVTDEVTRDGRDQVHEVQLTQVWVRTPDGWRCLAGHASRPVG
jgi:ketosteroid isomerase-like protein